MSLILNINQPMEEQTSSDIRQVTIDTINAILRGSYSHPKIAKLCIQPTLTPVKQRLALTKSTPRRKRTSVSVSNLAFTQLQHDQSFPPGEYTLVDVCSTFIRKSVKKQLTITVRKMWQGKRFTKDVGKFDGNNAFELVTEAKKLINTITEGGDISVTTFEAAYRKYQDEIQAKTRGKSTHTSRENKIMMAFGPQVLHKISTDTVVQFLATHSKTNSSYNRYLSRLKRIFNVFLRVELIAKSPAQGLSKRFEEPNPYNAMTEYEVKWFIHYAIKDANFLHKMALLVALTTGLRIGNVISLRKSQIDLHARTLFVQQAKNGKRLNLPINNAAYGLLKMLIEQSPTDYLFPSAESVTGHIAHPTECMQRIVKAMKDAGITDKHLVIHGLRHTAASMWYQQTADLVKVSRAMGHSSLHSTLRYAHTDVEGIREMTNNTWYQSELTGISNKILESKNDYT